jgi:hypothetical protein
MSTRTGGLARAVTLPLLALLLVGGVLAVQVANGGGEFEPLRPADACTERTVTSQADGIDGLSERLVLVGVTNAACTLGLSREGYVLDLAQGGMRSDAQIEALRDGLRDGVRQLDDEGTLPPASSLVDEALESADLNSFVEFAIRNLPDSVIDRAIQTDDVLVRAVDDLDLRALLDDLDDRAGLEAQVGAAVEQAVRDILEERVRDLVPGI